MKKLLLLLCIASSSLFAQLSIDPVNALCRDANPITLIANQPGGTWTGFGISDSINGTFNPQLVPNFTNYVTVAYYIGNDTAKVGITLQTTPSLWAPKTEISICSGQSIELHAYQFNCTNVVWTGDASSTDTAITVNSAGTYTVQGENNACLSNSITFSVGIVDTIQDFYTTQLAFISCSMPIKLHTGDINTNWENNVQDSTIEVAALGSYRYFINNNGCIQEGKFLVQANNNDISVNIPDQNICLGNTTLLNTYLDPQEYNILWSTNETTPNITVGVGTYTVEISKGNCQFTDTINVLANQNNSLFVYLANDTICAGSEIELSCGYDDQTNNILWSTNETSTKIKVGLGTYTVTVTDNNCNSGQATAIIVGGASVKNKVIEDVNSCFATAQLDGYNYDVASGSWSDANGIISNSLYTQVNQNGTYYVHQVYYNGCEIDDTVNVTLGNLDTNAIHNLLPNSYVSFCTGTSTTLEPSGTHVGYSWSKYSNVSYKYEEISTSQNLVIAEGGSYVLKVDEGNCKYSASVYASAINCTNGADVVNNYLSSNFARPGFTNYCYGNIQNVGNQSLSNCTYEITYDDSKLTFEPSLYNTPGITINANKVAVSLATITAGENKQIRVAFKVSSDVSLLGETLFYTSTISCATQETDINNNSASFIRVIGGAYDPNFVISNYGDGAIADSTSFIKYDVGFQNTGTDTAFNIRVTNLIDTNIFDLSSIKILGATHQYYMGVDNDGLITWHFNNILLPDSFVNEPASHGQIQFIIQLKKGLTVGTTLKDSANIYFDFNPAVITNTAYNILTSKDDVFELNKKDGSITIYPNPANDEATVVISNFNGKGNAVISFVDVTGKEVLSPIVNNNFNQTTSIHFSTEHLSSGLYFIKVTNEIQQSIRLMVQH